MTPEQLVSLCTAHGVRLDASAIGKGTERPELTSAEAAMACAGLSREIFHAVLYSYAGDQSVRSYCKLHLLEWALDERDRQQWPHRVERCDGERSKFLEQLVELFLLDESRPVVFRTAPELRPILLNVHAPTWRSKLAPIYAAIAHQYGEWLSLADSHIRRRTRNS